MALLWKMICNLGDPMSLRHPVSTDTEYVEYLQTQIQRDTHTHRYTKKNRERQTGEKANWPPPAIGMPMPVTILENPVFSCLWEWLDSIWVGHVCVMWRDVKTSVRHVKTSASVRRVTRRASDICECVSPQMWRDVKLSASVRHVTRRAREWDLRCDEMWRQVQVCVMWRDVQVSVTVDWHST